MTPNAEQIRINKLQELTDTRESLVQDIMLIDAQIEALTPVVDEIKQRREEAMRIAEKAKEQKKLDSADESETYE
jgi:hypothetical protein